MRESGKMGDLLVMEKYTPKMGYILKVHLKEALLIVRREFWFMQMVHFIGEVSKIIRFMDVAHLFISRMELNMLEIGCRTSQMARALSIISRRADTKEISKED